MATSASASAHFRKLVVAACARRGKDELAEEYERIGSTSPYRETIWGTSSHETMMADGKCLVASAEGNLELNRFCNILPFDSHLASCSRGFINASVVAPLGREFLIAQGPMSEPDTREAFLHTVVENNVSVMVNLAPFGLECADYIGPGQYGEMKVTVEALETLPNAVVVRKLKLESPNIAAPHSVHHIQFDDWPNYSMPYHSSALAKVAQLVLDHRAKTDPGPGMTMVNCSGGVGRSGTLVATLAVWESLCEEARKGDFEDMPLDTFKPHLVGVCTKAVETVRDQRHPWLVEGFGQYALIFETLHLLSA